MSIIKNIASKLLQFSDSLQQLALETATLVDGTVVEAEMFEVGQLVVVPTEDGEAVPLPAGAYELDNATTIQVDETGTITDVKETTETKEEEEAPAEEAAPAAAPESVMKAEQQAKKIVETQATTKETTFSAEEVETKIAKMREEIEKDYEVKMSKMQDEIKAIKAEFEAQPTASALSRAPKTQTNTPAPFYEKPTTASQRLANFAMNLKTEE